MDDTGRTGTGASHPAASSPPAPSAEPAAVALPSTALPPTALPSTALPGAAVVPAPALAAILFWGVSFVAVEFALESLQPFAIVSSRLLLGATCLALVSRVRGRPFLPSRESLRAVVVLGLVLAAHLSIQSFGLLYTSSVHTGWIVGFTPVVTALGAQLFLGKRLRGIGWVGVVIATSGVVGVTLERPAELVHASFGDLLQLTSCITWATYTLVAMRPVERDGALRIAGTSMAIAGALLLPCAAVFGWAKEGGAELSLASVGAVVYLGLLCNAVAFTLWYRSQAVHGVHRTVSMLYLQPFVTLAAAYFLLGDPLGVGTIVGGVVMLAGVWLVGVGARGT